MRLSLKKCKTLKQSFAFKWLNLVTVKEENWISSKKVKSLAMVERLCYNCKNFFQCCCLSALFFVIRTPTILWCQRLQEYSRQTA